MPLQAKSMAQPDRHDGNTNDHRTDSEGTRDFSPWTITVTTDGFRFVSPTVTMRPRNTRRAVATLLKVHTSAVSSDIIY